MQAVHQGYAEPLNQIGLSVGQVDDTVDHTVFELEHPSNGSFDELFGIALLKALDLDFLEEVVPGAAFALPVLLDLDAGNYSHQALGEALHEKAS